MVLEAAFRWSKKKTDTVHANVLTAYELHQVHANVLTAYELHQVHANVLTAYELHQVHANVLTAYELHQVTTVSGDTISLFLGQEGGGGGCTQGIVSLGSWVENEIVIVFSSTI